MKKTIIILSVLALMLVSAMPVFSMGLAEDMQKAGYKLPGTEVAEEKKVESLIQDAADFVKANYDKSTKATPAPRTTADFDVYDRITIKGQTFKIQWSTDTEYVTVEPKDSGIVTINIAEDAPEEIVYTLIAILTDAQGNEIVLNMPKTLPQGSTDPAPEEIVFSAYKLADGEYLPKAVRLSGRITSIPTAYSPDYGNITVNIQVAALADYPIQCYRLSGEGCADLKEGDLITVEGKVKNYKGTIEFDKPTLVGMGILPDQSATLDAAFLLADGEAMKGLQVLVGKIDSIPSAYSESYGNITVNLDVDGRIVQAYRLTGGADLAVGDTITVIGTIKNYKGTIEFDKGCRYVGEKDYSSVKTLLKAYQLEEGKALEGARLVVGTIVEIPSAYSPDYGNITVNIQVGGLNDLIIQCYRLTGGSDLAVGDTIAVSGNIKNYKGTIEFDKGCTYEKI